MTLPALSTAELVSFREAPVDVVLAESVRRALVSAWRAADSMHVVVCELAALVRDKSLWRELRDASGRLYQGPDEFFIQELNLRHSRTVQRYITVGRLISSTPQEEQEAVRAAVAAVGITKAEILAPAIETAAERGETSSEWFAKAQALPVNKLQEIVSEATEAKPRGVAPTGTTIDRVIAGRVDLEGQEIVARFFAVGRLATGSGDPLGILLAGMQEATASWEPHVSHRVANS